MNLPNSLWYQSRGVLNYLLYPASVIFQGISFLRRQAYQQGILKVTHFPIPVIVVGNITTGGTGKTPLVAALALWLKEQGFKPGIVSRGYGGKAKQWPQIVKADSDPRLVGDEAVMLATQTDCPIAVAPQRPSAVKKLLDNFSCDIIVSDDGLQHYALGRDIEIAVLDGEKRLGNSFCLPAGPLRETPKRLITVDYVIVNGDANSGEYSMAINPEGIINCHQSQKTLQLNKQTVHAVAGIGFPEKFFDTLKSLGFTLIEHAFPDHHPFALSDLNFSDNLPIIMTEKDAIKCQEFAKDNMWFLKISAKPEQKLLQHLTNKIQDIVTYNDHI